MSASDVPPTLPARPPGCLIPAPCMPKAVFGPFRFRPSISLQHISPLPLRHKLLASVAHLQSGYSPGHPCRRGCRADWNNLNTHKVLYNARKSLSICICPSSPYPPHILNDSFLDHTAPLHSFTILGKSAALYRKSISSPIKRA